MSLYQGKDTDPQLFSAGDCMPVFMHNAYSEGSLYNLVIQDEIIQVEIIQGLRWDWKKYHGGGGGGRGFKKRQDE